MNSGHTPVVKKPLYFWIFYKHLKFHFLLLLIIFVTVAVRVVPLEMQKRIINEAINLKDMKLLVQYCSVYLGAVIFASILKFFINVIQTTISEQVLSDMRKQLYSHILTLPLSFFRKTPPGMVVSSLITELTTSGNFAGMAISVPASSGLTLLAFAGYLFWLNPLLAVISLSIYPAVLLLIPMLQKRANLNNKNRVDTTRTLSNLIGETIGGIHEVHGNGSYHIENRKYSQLVNRLKRIRIIWTLYSQGIKLTNNFFNNLSPFLIFIIGGYLAMKGQLELGSLVAFLSAQEKLYDPWKELIEFYQVYQDASVRYKRTMQYFDAEPDHMLAPVGRKPYDLEGRLDIRHLSFFTEDRIQLLNDISLSLEPGEHLALVGFSGSGKSTLALCIAQLYPYSIGHIKIGNTEVSELTKKDMTLNTGFVSQSPFIFDGSIKDNLVYGCLSKCDEHSTDTCEFIPDIDDMIEILHQTGIFVDVLSFGLSTILNAKQLEKLEPVLIRIREKFRENFGDNLGDDVEFINDNKYLYHSSMLDNLIFGTSNPKIFDAKKLSGNTYFLQFLDKEGLTRPLIDIGSELSNHMVDILKNMPGDTIFFTRSPIGPDELDDYTQLVERMRHIHSNELSNADRNRLIAIALRFTPGIHKIISLPEALEQRIIEVRARFREKIVSNYPGAFSVYNPGDYIHSENILNNILFGKLKPDAPHAQEKINRSIIHLLIEENLLETIIEIGMLYQVGSKGDKLSGGQKQKLAIARTFLKSPKLLILDEATSALDNLSQTRIQNLLETRWKGRVTTISIAHRLDIIKNYDRVAVMKSGKVVELGPYDELMEQRGVLYELVTGRR